jgi:hypothetical protein
LLMQHLARRTQRELHRTIIDVPGPDLAEMTLAGLPLAPGRHEIILFSGIPLQVDILPAGHVEFLGWKGMDGEGEKATIIPGKTRSLKAKLASAGS